MVAATDKDKKRLAEKHHRILAELAKQPDNAVCADCGASSTRWASWNLGVFLCIRCGGLHRHIGTHISKVKSISLDNWTTEQLEHFRQIGNRRANAFFNPQARAAPRSDRDMERYIRDKYERRVYVSHGAPDPTTDPAAASSSTAAADEASALTQLRELGFLNVRDNHNALKMFAFDVEKAAEHLRGGGSDISTTDPRVARLLQMGFDSAPQNARALTACKGDVNQAIELLLSDNPPSREPSDSSPANAAPAPPPKPAAKAAAPASLLDNTSGGLNDLLDGLSISSSQAAAAAAPATAPASHDLFGDFGDFLSAPADPSTSTAAPQTAPQPATTASSSAVGNPSSPGSASARQSSHSMFDTNFIMSLYSKQGATDSAAAKSSSPQKPAPGGSSGFNDLDLLM
ncbi:Gtpase activating protein [Coemansia sp. RSA 552]|nr:Gtpase activating protein [Coemansia sp. RSA 552]